MQNISKLYENINSCLGIKRKQQDDSIEQTDCLKNYISKTFIIACKESTELLETTLNNEDLPNEVLRQKPSKEHQHLSLSYLCMMNHVCAWEKTVQQDFPSLIIEADFVPVMGLGQLPLPFNPQEKQLGIAWLYTCAPQIYHVSEQGYAKGYSTSMVAYIISPQSAKFLIDFFEQITKKYGSTNYSSWDSEIHGFLRSHNFNNYIPFRNYGEHGGVPNPEHGKNGLSSTHRADVLYKKLAFMPAYAVESSLKFYLIRSYARLKGIGRLFLGKFIKLKVVLSSSTPWRRLNFAISRQFTLTL